ncbi:MAG: carboxypeptidase regulatory-like domain-containing protein, partial [Holophagales bacterium]|nr:carboxypeptidase regulatory-like domain-containing protein [Holophagales bacterium]
MLTILVVLLCAVISNAQTGLGEITGFIFDEDGKGIEQARITIESDSLLRGRKLTSGNRGYFRVITLPPGNYTLTFSKQGYQTQEIKGISVRAGKTSSFNVTLKVGDFAETVTIVHDAPIIDLQSTERQLNIDGDFLRRLPLSPNQDWRTAWSMVPGIVSDADFNFNAGAIESVTVHGDKTDANAAAYFTNQNIFSIDGMNAMGALSATTSNQIAMDVIEDIEIVTSGFDASKPASMGGYMNVVTRSGGNEFSGSFTLIAQPEDWNWTNIDDGTPKSLEQYQPSFSLGGPIFKDRTWFFANYRYDFRNEGVSRTADTRARWAAFGLEMPTENNEIRNHTAFLKLTQQLSDNHKAAYSYIGSVNKAVFINATQSFEAANHGLFESNTHRIAVDSVWSDQFNTTFTISWNDGWNGTPEEFRDRGN